MRMTTKWMIPALGLALFTSAAAAHAQYGSPGGPPSQNGYNQGPGRGGWEAPPPEFREAQQRGFHDGVEGARRDIENRRRPNVNNRDEFRHPNIPRDLRRDYKDGFRRGYDVAMQHMMGGGPGPGRY